MAFVLQCSARARFNLRQHKCLALRFPSSSKKIEDHTYDGDPEDPTRRKDSYTVVRVSRRLIYNYNFIHHTPTQ